MKMSAGHKSAMTVRLGGGRQSDRARVARRSGEVVGLTGVRVHDLMDIAPSILFSRGVEEGIVRRITGHRSRELWRYQHLMPDLRKTTVNLVAEELLKSVIRRAP